MMLYEKPARIELEGKTLKVDGKNHHCSVRYLKDIQDVLMRQVSAASVDDLEMYFMYRSVAFCEKLDVRYDITVIPARFLGDEYNKTYGHSHPKAEDGVPYPELYQVLRGRGSFILQKRLPNDMYQVFIVEAKEGDTVLIPPGYGHVSVNRGEDSLVLANLVYDKFASDYSEYRDNHGAAYYMTKNGLTQNSRYLISFLERISPAQVMGAYGLSVGDLLGEMRLDPGRLEFLRKPSLLGRK
ncbi:MAG: glucose-6-phosphate isomerase family protein [Candidatus Bilamarchaeaceae archaeon]